MVAIGLLAIVLSFAGVIFNASIKTYRTAIANAEIMRKLRAITDRLDADFQGLCKGGEIFVAWVAEDRRPDFSDCDLDGFERFDRIMFFSLGDFQSYGTSPKIIRGNLARISYMLATRGTPSDPNKPELQSRPKRILARTQHILTSDPAFPLFFDPFDPNDPYDLPPFYTAFTDPNWHDWHNHKEYDKMATSADPPFRRDDCKSLSLEEWKHVPWRNKQDMLAVVTDVDVGTSPVDPDFRGAFVNPADPSTIHILLCEGVGEFKIQGWYDAERRWVPEVDPDGDGDLTDRTDFYIGDPDPDKVPGVLYPWRVAPGGGYGRVNINGIGYGGSLDETGFDDIPGLGRALKFTFTIFDSKGFIKQGRTFTHIVYLD